MYNGIYFQSTLFSEGRLGTDSEGRVCPLHSNWGVMKGNVVHSNQRFGWYPGAWAKPLQCFPHGRVSVSE